jgi:RND family efflux transporter MFP subunit
MKDLIVSVLVIGSLAFSGCGKRSGGGKPSAEKTEKAEDSGVVHLDVESRKEAGITIEEVRPVVLTEKLTVQGRVDFDQRRLAHLTSRVAGRVDQVFAFLGDRVRANQVLATVYSQEYLVAQSEFIQAEQRIDQLLARKDSTEELAAARSIYESARRKISVIGASDDDINYLITNHAPKTMLEIRAPFDGTVVETNEILGHFVDVGSLLYHIADFSSVWIIVDVYEKDIHLLATGMEAMVEVSAYPGVTFRGQLTRIFDVVDDKTRTIKARIEAENINHKLKPGMFASAILTTKRSSMVLALPAGSIQREGDKRYVFVVPNDSTFVKRTIEIGKETQEKIEILGGLKEGERVVINGAFTLKSEMLKESFGEGE